MNFTDFDQKTQDDIVDLLNKHLATSADILKKDRFLLPMMLIADTKQLSSLQPKDGNVDTDRAYAFVVNKLKTETFTYALFSHSISIETAQGTESDALKTCIFTGDGTEVSFYTPYQVKGFLRKSIVMEKTVLIEIKENVW